MFGKVFLSDFLLHVAKGHKIAAIAMSCCYSWVVSGFDVQSVAGVC